MPAAEIFVPFALFAVNKSVSFAVKIAPRVSFLDFVRVSPFHFGEGFIPSN
jgi:hypothetical protein